MMTKLEPSLKNGSILLSSIYKSPFFVISPSSIRHGSICVIENNNYFIFEINERGFTKYTLREFCKRKDEIYVLDHHDNDIMKQINIFIDHYKHYPYGFTSGRKYCFEFLYELYQKATTSLNKSINIPCFNVFTLSYFNSGSLMLSDDFTLKCAILFNHYIEFEKKL